MNLHHVGDRSDWENIAPDEWNFWQRMAAASDGLVTPANVISTVGFLLAGLGLVSLIHRDYITGFVLLVVGRLADAIDGYAADFTGTKSTFGEALDAGLDKAIAFLTLLVFSLVGILPLWLAVLIAAQNLANVAATWYGAARAITVQPSRNGKWAAFGYWASLSLFAATTISIVPAAWLIIPGYVLALAALVLGIDASYGYLQVARGKVTAVATTEAAFQKIVIIRNPVSSEAHRSRERIKLLRELLPECDVTVIQTSNEGKAANRTLLAENRDLLGPHTLLCIAAGDGTVNLIISALLHDRVFTPDMRRTPILPLWCGNANDLAYMLNGHWSRRRLRSIIRRGEVVPIKPLICTVQDLHSNSEEHTAASYASFGATAYATQELERVIPRGSPTRRFGASRFGQEIFATLRAMAQSPTFTVTEHDRTRIVYERTYLNGSRFAKIFGIPLRLTDEKFHRNTIERKRPLTLILNILGLLNSREISKRAITHDHFTLHDTVWAQFDGEAVKLMNGTEVDISISKQPFYALSLRLKS